MEIACSGSATVRTTVHHRTDATQIMNEFQRNFGKLIAQLSVRTVPRFIKPDAQLNLELINRGS